MSKENREEQVEEHNGKGSRLVQAKGVVKVATSILLWANPAVALGVGVAWVSARAIKHYREDTDHTKSFFQRAKETGAMMVGMEVGTILPLVGIAVAAVGAAYAAYVGNDVAGASMQGAVVGFAVKSVLLPVVMAGLGIEGVYNMASGKEIDIAGKALGLAMSIGKGVQRGLDAVLGKAEKAHSKALRIEEPSTPSRVKAKVAAKTVTAKVRDAAAEIVSQIPAKLRDSDRAHKSPPPAPKEPLQR
ncbi:MAG: hypothetical protein V4485_03060 [Pseudomonadota bacterium]